MKNVRDSLDPAPGRISPHLPGLFIAALLLAFLLRSSAVIAAASEKNDWRPDPWVTTKIKILLVTADEVSAFDVNVDTVDGRVTLHGKVPSEREKARAEEIALGAAGVVSVQNLLQVVPADEVVPTAVRDDALKRALFRAFASAPRLEDTDIRVKSVNQGVVLLSGRAKSLMEHLEAIRVASAVKGVRRVATEVESGDETYDAKLWRDAENGVIKRVTPSSERNTLPENASIPPAEEEPTEVIEDAADGGGPGMTDTSRLSDVMTDSSITATIKSRLLQDASVPGLSINVDTNDGVVTLFGRAYDDQARETAESHARTVAGVVDVRNQILIVDEEESPGQIGNEELAKEVRQVLDKRRHLERCNIAVSANEGVVRLQGEVPDSQLKASAATIAAAVSGVRSVDNQLQVRRN